MNADKPAMPVTKNTFDHDGFPKKEQYLGMTKREMIAMHISGHVMQSLNAGFIAGEWACPDFDELAQQAVEYTDALLKELEK